MQYLSSSLEDYLEIIYILMQNSDSVGITDIAKALSISKPSVNKAVNLLKEKGYTFDVAFSSSLKRANHTMDFVLDFDSKKSRNLFFKITL